MSTKSDAEAQGVLAGFAEVARWAEAKIRETVRLDLDVRAQWRKNEISDDYLTEMCSMYETQIEIYNELRGFVGEEPIDVDPYYDPPPSI